MDEKEKEILEWGKKNGKTKEQALAAVARYRTSQSEGAPKKSALGTNWLREIPGDIKDTFSGMKNAVTSAADTIVDAREQVTRGEISPRAGTVKTLGAGGNAIGGVFGEAFLGAGRVVLPEKGEEFVADTAQAGVEKVLETPQAQAAIEYYYSLPPEEQAYAEGSLGIIEGVSSFIGVSATSRLTGKAVEAAKRGMAQRIQRTAEKAKANDGQSFVSSMRESSGDVIPFLRKIDPEVDSAAKRYSRAITDSFVEDNTGISNKVDEMARMKGKTRDQLIEDWASRGYVPEIRGKKAVFEKERQNIRQQKKEIWEKEIEPKVTAIQNEFDADTLQDFLQEAIRGQYKTEGISGVRGVDLQKSERKIADLVEGYKKKYDTDTFTAEQLREIQTEMNSATNAFTREGWEMDAEETVAQTVRKIFDDLDPSISEANRRYGQLSQDEKIMDIFDNETVNVGVIGTASGQYGGTVLGGMAGLTVAGPGSLVIAGLMANLGGKVVASYLRRNRFNSKVKQQILDEMNNNQQLKTELMDEMTPEDKNLVEKEFSKTNPPTAAGTKSQEQE